MLTVASLPLTYEDYTLSDERRDVLQTLSDTLRESLVLSTETGCLMIQDTLDQSTSAHWHAERMLRITASKCKLVNSFGEKILGRRKNLPVRSMYQYISDNLWFPKNIQTKDISME